MGHRKDLLTLSISSDSLSIFVCCFFFKFQNIVLRNFRWKHYYYKPFNNLHKPKLHDAFNFDCIAGWTSKENTNFYSNFWPFQHFCQTVKKKKSLYCCSSSDQMTLYNFHTTGSDRKYKVVPRVNLHHGSLAGYAPRTWQLRGTCHRPPDHQNTPPQSANAGKKGSIQQCAVK